MSRTEILASCDRWNGDWVCVTFEHWGSRMSSISVFVMAMMLPQQRWQRTNTFCVILKATHYGVKTHITPSR